MRDIVTIGASAGGVETLQRVVAGLPGDLAASVFIVTHMPPYSRSYLPEILQRVSTLVVQQAADGVEIATGHIYVSCPDHHLTVEDGHMHVIRGPAENRQRPSINTLFRSAALAYGPRVIGVILTGMLDDGTAGLWEVKRRGGMSIVQDPEDAMFPDMPRNALAFVEVDHLVSAGEIPRILASEIQVQAEEMQKPGSEAAVQHAGNVDVTCPDCRGALILLRNGRLAEFRCRVGHSFSREAMLTGHREAQEKALWAAVVALEEGAELASMFARENGRDRNELLAESEEKRQQAGTIRRILLGKSS